MTGRSLGDLLAAFNASDGAVGPVDGFDLLLAVARWRGVAPEALLDEIDGPGELAAIARDLLGLADTTRRRPGAKPRKEDRDNWRMFCFVKDRCRRGEMLKKAVEQWAKEEGLDIKCDLSSIERQYGRLRKHWGGEEVAPLAALFAPPPPRKRRQ